MCSHMTNCWLTSCQNLPLVWPARSIGKFPFYRSVGKLSFYRFVGKFPFYRSVGKFPGVQSQQWWIGNTAWEMIYGGQSARLPTQLFVNCNTVTQQRCKPLSGHTVIMFPSCFWANAKLWMLKLLQIAKQHCSCQGIRKVLPAKVSLANTEPWLQKEIGENVYLRVVCFCN